MVVQRKNTKAQPKTETVVDAVENVDVVEVVEKVEKVETKPVKRELTDSTKVSVMNNTTGRYGYIGKSGYSFELEEYGDIAEIPFSEIRSMVSSSQKRHITDAFIIILDEDVVKELNYTKLYQNILDQEGIENLLANPEKLKEALPNLPTLMRETVLTFARQKVKNNELWDNRVINAIKEIAKIDISE